MNNETEIIRTEKLTKSFGHITAVNSLDMSVRSGEIFGMVGPDGAGKTTTIRMLAAIMTPTSGTATVMGYDTIKGGGAIKHEIGYMAQQFSLYSDLTVLENLEFFADLFAVRGKVRRERIDRLLNFARLTEFTKRRAGRLSGGMKKKLGLACSLIHEPKVLYLDEPTTGVDPVSRREFWDILADLHVQGVTILVSTPYMDEAERCSRVGLMYEGQLVECDTPENLKSHMQGQMLALRPTSDQYHGVGLMRRAQAVARDLPGVIEVQTYGDLLHVFVDGTDGRERELVTALNHSQIEAHELRRTRPRMEEVFISLIEKQEAAGRNGA